MTVLPLLIQPLFFIKTNTFQNYLLRLNPYCLLKTKVEDKTCRTGCISYGMYPKDYSIFSTVSGNFPVGDR
jgi:hypothetical protein